MRKKLLVSIFAPLIGLQGVGDLYLRKWREFKISLLVSIIPITLWLLFVVWFLNYGQRGWNHLLVLAVGGWAAIAAYGIVWFVNNYRYINYWVNSQGRSENSFSIIRKAVMFLLSLVPPIIAVIIFLLIIRFGLHP